MSTLAYRQTQRAVEDPRQLEYRLFGQITGVLIDAQNSKLSGGPLAEAIDRNRRMWSSLAADCLDDRNRLPLETRAHIVSLSMWVARYSKEVMRKGSSMDPLIEINRTIMLGLKPQA